jgi:mannose-6-phosphate isomerase
MKFEAYPILFNPILKERIWGGKKLKTVLNKTISSDITGESWEISTVVNDVSIVANGTLKGKSLNDLLENYPEAILGAKVYKQFGNQFPLLFKFLDAREDLSIQLHPNDALAKKRHNSFGKTEMWYVMQADEGARIIVGFKENSNHKEYLQNLQNKTLVSILDEVTVKKGDVFFLETGTIHAIGAGIVIAEIQQTSDITYRIYDFDRKDAQGNTRELHNDLALEAINYEVVKSKREYATTENKSNNIVTCPYFITNFIALDGKMNCINNKDSFIVLMCTEGSLDIVVNAVNYAFNQGDTILIPAIVSDYQLSGKATILEIHL